MDFDAGLFFGLCIATIANALIWGLVITPSNVNGSKTSVICEYLGATHQDEVCIKDNKVVYQEDEK